MDGIIWNIKQIDIEQKLATIQQLAPIPEIYYRKRRKWIHTIPGHEDHPQQWTIVINLVQQTHRHWPQ